MNIDLDKIARLRSRLGNAPGGMDYLMSPVRRELEERITSASGEPRNGLVIDFSNGDLDLASIGQRTSFSFLETTSGPGFEELQENSYDCIVINLQPVWLDFRFVVAVTERLLEPGGALWFSTFGPDTLAEVRRAWQQVDEAPHVFPFVDMHHLGDQLVQGGFRQPIVDADWLQVAYDNPSELFEDIKSEGFGNFLQDRRKTLTGKTRFQGFMDKLLTMQDSDGQLRITFEVVYGYARKPEDTGGGIRVSVPTLDT